MDPQPAEEHGRRPAAGAPLGFACHICGEPSDRICLRCTRDACDNHLCERCERCSDCCECDEETRGRA